MSTARYSTDLASVLLRVGDEAIRATADVRALVAFRAAAVRGRGRNVARAAFAVIVVLTVGAAWLPAYLPGAAGTTPVHARFSSHEALLLLPTAYVGVLLISIVSAASSGGGRELLARDQAVAFPVSPTTDHLGALLMAPLNIAWLLQSWAVLGATAFVIGPHNLLAAQVPVLLWLAVATAFAQLVAWLVEWVRRLRHGVWVVRGVVAALAAGMATVIMTDHVVFLLDRSPTIAIILAALDGSRADWGAWMQSVIGLLSMALTAVLLGAYVAHALVRRVARDELRVESSVHSRRVDPSSDLLATLRVDRAGVWRSVPLRRGFAVLALLPGLVAVASALEWYMLNVLPGLVASGGALLFGVNAWCLDGRGALWRESLPVHPRLVFVARVIVLLEVLFAAVAITLLLASLRAGVPTVAQLVAVLCSTVVVTFQVVSGSMRWSVRRPFAVDMRSARATPAPPLTMVGYSTRLALVTTFTGMLFVGASSTSWQWSVLIAVTFLSLSLLRLSRTSADWEQSETRSRVITAVAS